MKNSLHFYLLPIFVLACTTFASTKGTLCKLYTATDGDMLWSVSLSVLIVLTGFIGTGVGITLLLSLFKSFSAQKMLTCFAGLFIGFGAVTISLWTESSYSVESLREVNSFYFETKEKINNLQTKSNINTAQINELQNSLSQVGDGWLYMCDKFGLNVYYLVIGFFTVTELAGVFCGSLTLYKILHN